MQRTRLIKFTFTSTSIPKNYRETVQEREINHFAPYVGARPVTYKIPKSLINFSKNLDKEIDYFFSKVDVDQWNEKYFDKIIDEQIELALKNIDLQQVQHKRSIQGIRQNLSSYKTIYEQKVKEIDKQISKNKDKEGKLC